MNYEVFQLIHGWSGHFSWLDSAMVFISKYALLLFAICLVVLWLGGSKQVKRAVLFAGFTGIAALIVNNVIGHIYFEPRPFVSHPVNLLYPHDPDASFPSDHSTGAFALAIAILLRKRLTGSWGISMLALAVLTGLSRVYVGHHYPGDVIGSIVVAGVIGILFLAGERFLAPLADLIIAVYEKVLQILFGRKSRSIGSGRN
ncbi:undecaprenyl-diphosphatase [Brevibacillus massiliensis]|jgi:undecaprenyl-diphosphatase|uniref:undecaprenyl-diphosphatase n=1 Tax=Brevibacillus massiliensis TaxID=1118054 RepID=UPI0002F1060C|nr:undecaprenyl-diphosphatase [Brevibacillus massiliensis]